MTDAVLTKLAITINISFLIALGNKVTTMRLEGRETGICHRFFGKCQDRSLRFVVSPSLSFPLRSKLFSLILVEHELAKFYLVSLHGFALERPRLCRVILSLSGVMEGGRHDGLLLPAFFIGIGDLYVVLVLTVFSLDFCGLVHLHCPNETVRIFRFHTEIFVRNDLVVDCLPLHVDELQIVFVFDLVRVGVLLAGVLGLDNDLVVFHNFLFVFP